MNKPRYVEIDFLKKKALTAEEIEAEFSDILRNYIHMPVNFKTLRQIEASIFSWLSEHLKNFEDRKNIYVDALFNSDDNSLNISVYRYENNEKIYLHIIITDEGLELKKFKRSKQSMSIQSDYEADYMKNGPAGPGCKENGEYDMTYRGKKEDKKEIKKTLGRWRY